VKLESQKYLKKRGIVMRDEQTPFFGEEAIDTESGRPVWWDGYGWSYVNPIKSAGFERIFRESRAKRPLLLVKQERPENIRLSYAQQRLWFIDRLEGTSTEYNIPEALRLRGELDAEALERAINTIVERHESLRTHFAEVDGEPAQVIEEKLRIEAPVEDLSGMGEREQQERVKAALRREWEEAFDLGRGPLLRMRLLR